MDTKADKEESSELAAVTSPDKPGNAVSEAFRNDEILGTLREANGNWHGRVEIAPGYGINISLLCDEEDSLDLLIARARRLIELFRRNELGLRRAVSERMLELYNDTWRDPKDDRDPIDAATFAGRIRRQG
jgi:hypothetical protein